MESKMKSVVGGMILFFILLNFQLAGAEENTKKDPFLAGVLSFYLPGLGQYYINQMGKGTLFLLTHLLIETSLLMIERNYQCKLGFGKMIKFVPKEVEEKKKERLILYLTLCAIFVRTMSTIDSIKETIRYNQMIEEPVFGFLLTPIQLTLTYQNFF
jgi:hypothetical protein